jgi:hypothetical protein
MARVRSPELDISDKPNISDDSWGLVLIPVLACVALMVSAFMWL